MMERRGLIFDAALLEFAKELRNFLFELASDSFNPFGTMSLSYSMWSEVGVVNTL